MKGQLPPEIAKYVETFVEDLFEIIWASHTDSVGNIFRKHFQYALPAGSQFSNLLLE